MHQQKDIHKHTSIWTEYHMDCFNGMMHRYGYKIMDASVWMIMCEHTNQSNDTNSANHAHIKHKQKKRKSDLHGLNLCLQSYRNSESTWPEIRQGWYLDKFSVIVQKSRRIKLFFFNRIRIKEVVLHWKKKSILKGLIQATRSLHYFIN